jgi:hypothetical protein
MSAVPYAKPGFMSPIQAAYLAKRARKAVRAGLLTPHHFTVLEILLWEVRPRGSDRAAVSYSRLQELAGRCRQTVADAIKAGLRLGLLRKIKHKTLTLWANGGRKWRQTPNEYVFHCESTAQTEYPKEVIQILKTAPGNAEIRSAQAAMAERARVIQARLLTRGRLTAP